MMFKQFTNRCLMGFFIMTLLLVLMPGVSAISDLGYHKRCDVIRLPQTCDDCTFNNITSIILPNKSVQAINNAMTQDGTFWYYDYSNTCLTGKYFVNGVGNEGGSVSDWTYTFSVNPSGEESTSILDNVPLIIFGIFAVLLIALGVFMKNEWFGFVGSIMFLLGGIYTMIYGFNNSFNLYTQGVGVTMIGLGIVFMFTSAYEWMAGGE